MKITGIIIVGVVASGLVGCDKPTPSSEPRRYLALLGVKSDAVIRHVQTTCSGRALADHNGVSCFLSNREDHYRVDFDARNRIRTLAITSTLADATQIFDRAFAPIVPEQIREVLRRSLTTAKDEWLYWTPGGAVAMNVDLKALAAGESNLIMWSVLDVSGDYSGTPAARASSQ